MKKNSFLEPLLRGFIRKKQEEDSAYDKERLRSHPIFYEVRRYDNICNTTNGIADAAKRRLAICYLRIVYNTVNDIANEAVENYRRYTGNMMELTSMMYEKYDLIESIAKAQGVPDIFLAKITPRIFENLATLTQVTNEIHPQHRYSNQCDEMLSFFDTYLLQTRYTYNAIGGIISSMNGELHRALEGSVFDIS